MNKVNINQIYHTSHCGSTLMSTLLANSTNVYCEPPWSENILLNCDLEIPNDFNNIVIKFGSGWCPFSNNLPGKKVFLYRKLNHHLFKVKSFDYFKNKKYEHHLNHCHPSLKEYEFKSDLEKISFIWLNNVKWISDVDNVLWVESNSFFENKKGTMNKVCDHFNLERVKNYELSNVHVKSFNLIGNEKPINQVEIPNLGVVKTLYPSFGIIEDDLASYDTNINDVVFRVEDIFPEMKEFLY